MNCNEFLERVTASEHSEAIVVLLIEIEITYHESHPLGISFEFRTSDSFFFSFLFFSFFLLFLVAGIEPRGP